MRLYHGTTRASADGIVGPPAAVDVSRGGGEFGRGFYLGESEAFAWRWVLTRFATPAVVAIDVPVSMAEDLRVRELDHAESNALRATVGKRRRTHLVGTDVVVGTIQNEPRRVQHKYESDQAQRYLNERADLVVLTTPTGPEQGRTGAE